MTEIDLSDLLREISVPCPRFGNAIGRDFHFQRVNKAVRFNTNTSEQQIRH